MMLQCFDATLEISVAATHTQETQFGGNVLGTEPGRVGASR